MDSERLKSSITSILPFSFTFSRLGAGNSSIFLCETKLSEDATSGNYLDRNLVANDQQGHVKHSGGYQHQLMSTSTPRWAAQRPLSSATRFMDTPSRTFATAVQHSQTNLRTQNAQVPRGHVAYDTSPHGVPSPPLGLTNYHTQHSTRKLLPPIKLASHVYIPTGVAQKSLGAHPPNEGISATVELPDAYQRWSVSDGVPAQDTQKAPDSVPVHLVQRSGCNELSLGERSLHKTSGSRELRRQAAWAPVGARGPHGEIDDQQPITPPRKPRLGIEASSSEGSVEEAVIAPTICAWDATLTPFQRLTTVTSLSKPRLTTISPRTPSAKTDLTQLTTPLEGRPALVSAFSPDTPPQTPDVANRIGLDEDPTCSAVGKHGGESLETKICYPITPPNSRVPTPFDRLSSSSCFRKRPCWGQPMMTQLDQATAWILQELEVLLAEFPVTALRLNSPVIERIRLATSGPAVLERNIPRHRSSTAPHSRYSPYRPVLNLDTGARSPHPQQPSQPSRNTNRDVTASALRTVFPSARLHHLDSLHATYLALYYVTNLPSSDFAAASTSEGAASPYYTTSAQHSRSSSVASNIPPKARAMLGLEPLAQTSPPPPSLATSWFRASTPELEPAVKIRLENVELLLETSVRRILVEIEGRSLGEQDDALVRAVGEVVRMGEKLISPKAS
ncbi:MAG: hypothetical protein L6R39_000734 [Caloplaca ligustica]|nr:MAG: hypothetical protein L6R39_000734 [Caloplaca ligustica]